MDEEKLNEFINYVSKLKGYEKGEAQLFLDRLFIAFGHKGVIEADAALEYQIKIDYKTKFCDLLWPKKVLIEMKKRGEKLSNHFMQAKEYWDNTYGGRTEYVILCNFDEFWIYNWNFQRDPLDQIKITELNKRWRALGFLCKKEIKPIFGNNLVEVTEKAADKIALLYNKLIERGIEKDKAQRFVMQCLVALFAEDSGLFPEDGFFIDIINECLNGQSSYDLFTSLFCQMNSKDSANGGRFKGVDYFNGGIFSETYAIELQKDELDLLLCASKYDWSKVQPSIFGSIFEDSLHAKDRHTYGAHFTYESDIMRIVEPTILRPWRKRIARAKTRKELETIRDELSKFKILDPACGSGNFLYVSFRELKHLELSLLQKMKDNFPSTVKERLHSVIKGNQFYGIDTNHLGVELAKITLSMAKKFAADEFNKFTSQDRLFEGVDKPLPFDNLDDKIICGDALFLQWPKVDAIIGNPPYQSKNKMIGEFGPEYVESIHEAFPEMPGRADYCVYWFRKAHDCLPKGGRAGLVGTNTISQTYSRRGGLDYIVSNEGTIVEAVKSMPWSGKAVVHVSIVNWVKGLPIRDKKRKLAIQLGEKKDGSWEEYDLEYIPSSLSPKIDVTKAKKLNKCTISKACSQGQTHGHDGFLLTLQQRNELIKKNKHNEGVIYPYLNAEDLLGTIDSKPSRFIIDFQPRTSIHEVAIYKEPFELIKNNVLPTMIENAEKEKEQFKNAKKKVKVRQNHLKRWWLFWRRREGLINQISNSRRFITCARVTKRPIFEFISSTIRPNDALTVFSLEDDYSFGILQSTVHWEWFKERCSTLKADFRYTSETVFETFPWPQWGTLSTKSKVNKESKKTMYKIALNVATAAKKLRSIRNRIKHDNKLSLRNIYRMLELPGDSELKRAHEKLDRAVLEAYYYGFPKKMKEKNILQFLLDLNLLCLKADETGKEIIGPGLPSFCHNKKDFFSNDCIKT